MGHGRGPGGSSFLLLCAWTNLNHTNPTSNAQTAAATADNPDSLTVSIVIAARGKDPPSSPSANAILSGMQPYAPALALLAFSLTQKKKRNLGCKQLQEWRISDSKKPNWRMC